MKKKLSPVKHQSHICSNFWQLIGNKKFKFIQRSFYLHTDSKVIQVPGIFGLGKKLKINLCNVKEVREGFATDNWIEFKYRQENGGIDIAPNFYHFSIILKSTSPEIVTIGRSLDLMTDKYDDYRLWINTLRKIIQKVMEVDSKIYLNQIAYDVNSNMMKDFDKFLVDTKKFLDEIFFKYAIQKTNFIDSQGLQNFCQIEQKETKTLKECEQLISHFNNLIHKGYEIINQTLTESYLSRRAFYHLFESEEFALFDQKHNSVCQDMSQPMSHYYIASSHNSYLSGNQITSSSSYEMYRKILQNGCRCIEIDVWEDNYELVVYHGMTMTSKIYLRGVLETINEVAFEQSEYPLIISIENRCKREKSQFRMTQMIKEIFKDRLYIDSVDECNESKFPSPEEMKGRIFIKGIENVSSESDSDSVFNDFNLDANNNVIDPNETVEQLDCFDLKYFLFFNNSNRKMLDRRRKNVSPQASVIEGDFDSDEDRLDRVNCKFTRVKRIRKKRKIVDKFKIMNPHKISRPESLLTVNLQKYNSAEIVFIEEIFSKCSISSEINGNFSYLINYFKPKKFLSIEDCLDNFQFNEMISRNEIASKQLLKDKLHEYRTFTTRNMVRVYPHAWRQDSSNYIPVDHWNAGAQMVALNYQQISMPMLVNLAHFAQNGNCGYVLKPQYVRTPDKNEPILTRTILKIKIICGQFWDLFKSCKKDTSLKVTIRAYSALDKHRKSTRFIEKNCTNPIWNEEFTFKLKNPKLTFVQFTLVNKSSFVGNYMIAFPVMKTGFRHISLVGHDLKILKFSRIFLHVDYFNIEA